MHRPQHTLSFHTLSVGAALMARTATIAISNDYFGDLGYSVGRRDVWRVTPLQRWRTNYLSHQKLLKPMRSRNMQFALNTNQVRRKAIVENAKKYKHK